MAEFTEYDRKRLDDIHSVVTNGLKDNVRRLSANMENINQTIDYIKSEQYKADTCPILKQRRKRRVSWDWVLTMIVGTTAIISSVVTLIYMIAGE